MRFLLHKTIAPLLLVGRGVKIESLTAIMTPCNEQPLARTCSPGQLGACSAAGAGRAGQQQSRTGGGGKARSAQHPVRPRQAGGAGGDASAQEEHSQSTASCLQAAEPAAARQDRQSLCLALLVDGRPQAFIDFFELTARRPGGDSGGSGGGGLQQQQQEQQQQALDPDGLQLVHGQLVRADAALKAGDARGAFGALKQLGRFFAQLALLDRAAEFYGRCRQVRSAPASTGCEPRGLQLDLF
jgi:hypothetical protein